MPWFSARHIDRSQLAALRKSISQNHTVDAGVAVALAKFGFFVINAITGLTKDELKREQGEKLHDF